MKNRYFTITIVPEKKRSGKKIKVSSSFLKWSAIFSCTLALFFSYIVVDYFSILKKVGRVNQVLMENANLLTRVEKIQSKLVSMNISLNRINLFAKKLKALTNYQGNVSIPVEGLTLGIGPLTAEEVAFKENEEILKKLMSTQSKKAADSSQFINTIEQQVDALNFKTNFQELSLTDFNGYIGDKESLLRATPSIWPARGWLSSKFGLRRSGITGDVQMHKGIDIASNYGNDVRASADGTVIDSGFHPEYGKVIILNHGHKITTLYGHNSFIGVKIGQKVKRGDKIAKVGSTGRSTGSHLHYEVRLNGKPVNPANYLLN